MDYYDMLYWITRLDGINTLVTVMLVLSAVVVIVSFVFYLISFDSYTYENPLNVRKLTIKLFKIGIPFLIISAIVLIFVPTTKEAMIIYGGGKTLEFAKQDSSLNKIPYQATKVITNYLDKQLNQINKQDTAKGD